VPPKIYEDLLDILKKKGSKTIILDLLETVNKESYFSDITFLCWNTKNPSAESRFEDRLFAHKIIIEMRCPILWNSILKLEQDSNDNHSSTKEEKLTIRLSDLTYQNFDVSDFTSDVFRIFLSFVYSDCVEDKDWDMICGNELISQLSRLAQVFDLPR
jgi:hypothetical protein